MTQDDPRIAAAAPFLHGIWQRGLCDGAPPDDVDIRDLLRRLDAVPAPEGEAGKVGLDELFSPIVRDPFVPGLLRGFADGLDEGSTDVAQQMRDYADQYARAAASPPAPGEGQGATEGDPSWLIGAAPQVEGVATEQRAEPDADVAESLALIDQLDLPDRATPGEIKAALARAGLRIEPPAPAGPQAEGAGETCATCQEIAAGRPLDLDDEQAEWRHEHCRRGCPGHWTHPTNPNPATCGGAS